MGEWVIGAGINIIGSITINFGTNLLKLGHDQRESHSIPCNVEDDGKIICKPIVYFRTWRIGILLFALGNCLNFVSFAFAAQSLLAALGSIQFVSNLIFAYFVFHKNILTRVLLGTAFIVFGNIFLVSFGNHQSPVYTSELLIANYSNSVFLLYCLSLALVVALNQYIYRSNMLRLTVGSNYKLDSWFTYLMLLLLFCTGGFWMARLNEGLSQFDAIFIVPMFQLVWTFFSVCTGFVYFQEYQAFDAIKLTMFLLGLAFVSIGILLLAPDDAKANDGKPSSTASQVVATNVNRLAKLSMECEANDVDSFDYLEKAKTKSFLIKAKAAFSLSLGLCRESATALSALVVSMVFSTSTGFVGSTNDRTKYTIQKSSNWGSTSIDDDKETQETGSLLP
ncbi:probable magnesium transporter NIPA8 isoform X5 [Ananas comosus]|uniref:Probable magnesium transporter n=1 Tax=Ananas comosus TaxID=4615 RepID=A0A6P5GRB7_ANACO|nr:probable magnesium transporter NIPA8 isoform X5 [Ananas comosus]